MVLGTVFLVGGHLDSPKLLDFGIARPAETSHLTATGAALETARVHGAGAGVRHQRHVRVGLRSLSCEPLAMHLRVTLVAALAASFLRLSPDARANGRFPEANHVFVSATDPQRVLLRVTFGLLVSIDGGKRWGWVCEQALGVRGIEDPMFPIARHEAQR